jgi:heptose I phosphotransferase
MMSTRDGLLLRSLRDRENWRLRLDGGAETSAPASGAYLKKHHTRTVGSWLRAKAGWGPGQTAGRVEARNVASLARGGIAAMRLIAYGEKLHDDGLLESFVLTEELVGYTQLDHFLRQRFAPRSTTRATRRDPCLEELLRSVARVASQFHRLGYNHRDLYCCHFFIRETSHGNFQVNLIDLQRVEHRHRLRRRWLVKDLAQLAYSVPRDRVTCTQKLAFMKHYLGVRKLDRSHKRFIRQVLAKQHAMERNLGAHP